jgi:hypothetical protein
MLSGGTGNYTTSEIVFQSPDQTIANATSKATVQTWNAPSHIITVTNIYGEFTDNVTIIGASSNARYTLSVYDPLFSPAHKEVYDNKVINVSSGDFLDTSETNSFGSI